MLGALGLIDNGEMDWKVIVIALDDPMSERIYTLRDMEREIPGTLMRLRHWFQWYKFPQR